MAKHRAALLLLLAIQQTAAYRLTPGTEAEEKDPGALAQTTQDSDVYWCASFCIPCESGKRAVLVSRSKPFWTHLIEWTATAAVVTVGAVVTPWVFLGIPALMVAKVYFDELPIQCPNLGLIYFDKNEEGGQPDVKKFDQERLTAMLAKDEYLQLFRKDLNRVYAAEQAAKDGRDASAMENLFAFANRTHNQLPDSLIAYASSSDLFCGDQDGNLGEVMEEHLGWGSALIRECKQVVSPPTRCCCKKEKEMEEPECKLMQEDELNKSINPFKWGHEVCPASVGYHRYTYYGIDEPDVCKQ